MAAVAHPLRQEDIHPLLRHPKPIKRDTAKAHRMLGLVAQDEEKIKALQREKSLTTRWLERPMYEHLEISDIDSEREDATRTQKVDSVHEERKDGEESDDELSPALQSWLKPERPGSFGSEASLPSPIRVEPKTKLDTSFVKRRPQPIECPRPLSYTAQHLLTSEWTTSPSTMSPMTPRTRPVSFQPNSPLTRQLNFSSSSLQGPTAPVEHSQSLQIPPFHPTGNASGERPTSLRPDCFVSKGSPMADKPRPRPTSFATFPHQGKRNSKIASSRGLRNNSYPNFSRPISGIAPRVVPGEQMENDFVYQRFHDDEVGPPSPVSPIRHALDGFEAAEKPEKCERKPKKRWSAIPLGIKNFTRRRSSAAAQEPPSSDLKTMSIESLCQMNLTKENLEWYENEVIQQGVIETTVVPETRMSAADLLPTPKNSPFDMKHPLFETPLPLPFAPWADSPPSPAASTENRRSSQSSSLSPTRKAAPSSLSIESVPQHQPVSPSSPRSSVPVTRIPSPSTAPQLRLPPASPFTTDIRGADSPRPTTSSRRSTPLLERTCIICQCRKQPTAFLDRRITSNCWHEPATCRACLQSWVDTCLITEDWSQCTCPECGESMDHTDIGVWSQKRMA